MSQYHWVCCGVTASQLETTEPTGPQCMRLHSLERTQGCKIFVEGSMLKEISFEKVALACRKMKRSH